MRIRIPTVDRYVVTELAGPFVGATFFFSFIFLMFQMLRLADFFIVHGVPLALIAKLVGYMVISFSPMVLPVAFLVAVLTGFGRLSADSELVAMKASGIGLRRLTVPVMLFAAIVAMLSLWLNLSLVPRSDLRFRQLFLRGSKTQVVKSLQEGAFTSSFFGLLIFVDRVDPVTSRLKNVFIFDERQEQNPFTVIAKEGELVPVASGQEFGETAVLKLYDGNVHSNNLQAGSYQKIDFEEYRLFLDVAEGAEAARPKARMLEFSELTKRIQANDDVLTYRAELWRRYALAACPFVFAFLGIGFGTARTRSVKASSTLITFIVIFVYWMLLVAAQNAAQRGQLPAPLALFIPNLVLLAASIFPFRSARW